LPDGTVGLLLGGVGGLLDGEVGGLLEGAEHVPALRPNWVVYWNWQVASSIILIP